MGGGGDITSGSGGKVFYFVLYKNFNKIHIITWFPPPASLLSLILNFYVFLEKLNYTFGDRGSTNLPFTHLPDVKIQTEGSVLNVNIERDVSEVSVRVYHVHPLWI